MSDSTHELYAGRRLILCSPGYDRTAKSDNGEPLFRELDVFIADPLLAPDFAVIIEPEVPPAHLHRLIFGSGDDQ